MKRKLGFVLAILFTLALDATGASADMQEDIDRAVSIIERFQEIPESAIPPAAIYTYGRNQGIFGGVSLEGTVIATRYSANEEYYGKPMFPADILAGNVKPPPSAQKLLDVLKY